MSNDINEYIGFEDMDNMYDRVIEQKQDRDAELADKEIDAYLEQLEE